MSAKELNLTNINNQSNNTYEHEGNKTTEATITKHKNFQTNTNLNLYKEIEQ